MSSDLSKLVQPFLEIISYKDIQIPFEYTQDDQSTIINDFIYNAHPKLSNFNLINKQVPIPQSFPQQSLPTISTRKAYEITQFSNHIHTLRKAHEFEFIIDIGSGKSYLGHTLSPTFKVINIEKNTNKIKTSKRFGAMNGNNQIHHTTTLDFDHETLRFINSRKKFNNTIPKALVIGLDTCGDLSNTIMDAVIRGLQGVEVIGCCFVSCCNHKVTHFISNKFKNSRVNFGNACCSQDLRFLSHDEIILAFKKEFYHERAFGLGYHDVGGCKNEDYTSWDLFISKIQICHRVEQSKDLTDELSMFKKWCYTRGFLSHVLEDLIHQDRESYLLENGVELVTVEVIFEFTKSSRNVLITGIK